MLTQTLLYALLLGGLLGLVGQAIRMIVGLKKTYDQSQDTNTKFSETFETKRLGLSLVIGFTAGILGALALNISAMPELSNETLSALIGIGYSGTDFIEGFIRKVTPKENSTQA